MPNNYFKFKQFTIHQDRCAMKVGTDGVLLGAWVNCKSSKKILDIGTGTGLIALMLAQRSNAIIDAIEIDKSATEQAQQNSINSPWKNRIIVSNISFQKFANVSNTTYDLIVTNPPYFTKSLHAPSHTRNLARHDNSLTIKELIEGASQLLTSSGLFSLILPYDKVNEIKEIAQLNNLFPVRILHIKPTLTKSPKRSLIEFSHDMIEEISEIEIAIETSERHKYTVEYKNLTQDFYLAF